MKFHLPIMRTLALVPPALGVFLALVPARAAPQAPRQNPKEHQGKQRAHSSTVKQIKAACSRMKAKEGTAICSSLLEHLQAADPPPAVVHLAKQFRSAVVTKDGVTKLSSDYRKTYQTRAPKKASNKYIIEKRKK